MHNLFFYIALAFIIVHEMDAIRCKEWRIFPGLSLLDDKKGFAVFTMLHIPLFSLGFYYLFRVDHQNFMIGLDYFFIIHMFLHILFLFHKKNEFKDFLSWFIIVGAALAGVCDLMWKA